MKKLGLILFAFVFLIIQLWQNASAENLQVKILLSAKGGLCSSLGNGFAAGNSQDGKYALGISAEYFFLDALSGGLVVSSNSFQGDWHRSMIPEDQHRYRTNWNWTSFNLFTRFVLEPQSKASPYLLAGIGLYIPKVKDKWYQNPDTIYTHTSYGKGHLGYHFGGGIQYLLSKKMLVFLEVPLIIISTNHLSIHWLDEPRKMEQGHDISEPSLFFNVFAGISFFW
jgi:opacity protein-like surface antigen